jgi:hypothetical protein
MLYSFGFDNFESLLENFGLVWTSSKLGNFGVGDGESLKSQYHSYVTLCPYLILNSSPKMFQKMPQNDYI